MHTEFRCPNGIKFGDLDDGVIEVKCRSNRCGAGPGIVVLHRFDASTGKLLQTKRFRDLKAQSNEGGLNAPEHDPVAVRTA